MQDSNGITWLKDGKSILYTGETDKDSMATVDYGLMLRIQNPSNYEWEDFSAIVFSGHFTYGTKAAAEYFSNQLGRCNKEARNLAIIIHYEISS